VLSKKVHVLVFYPLLYTRTYKFQYNSVTYLITKFYGAVSSYISAFPHLHCKIITLLVYRFVCCSN